MDPNAVNMPDNPTQRNQMFAGAPPMVIDAGKSYKAMIRTGIGEIECELYANEAPQTVNNFVYLARYFATSWSKSLSPLNGKSHAK